MGLVTDHHHVVAVAQGGKPVLVGVGGEFLNRGEDDAATGTVGQQLPQVFPGLCLLWVLGQEVPHSGKNAEQLPVQILTVGDHHQGGVLEAWVAEQLARQTGHLDALAGALGVPDHATLTVPARFAGHHHPLHRCPHRVELMVGGNFLGDGAVLLRKEAKRADELQESPLVEEATDQGFQLAVLAQGVQVLLCLDQPPLLEAFPCSRQRPHPRLDAVADHQQHVGREQVGNVGLVGPELVKRCPDVCFLMGGILQFHHRDG